MVNIVYAPHDLLWLQKNALFDRSGRQEIPAWSHRHCSPVVVRRDRVSNGWIPIGVRGENKAQRFAGLTKKTAVTQCISPRCLLDSTKWKLNHNRCTKPAIRSLSKLIPSLNTLQLPWGITGSVAYELATGTETITNESDLDLIFYASTSLPYSKMKMIAEVTTQVEIKVDVQIETSLGAFALQDYLCHKGLVLLKTDTGPVLTSSPWQIEKVIHHGC